MIWQPDHVHPRRGQRSYAGAAGDSVPLDEQSIDRIVARQHRGYSVRDSGTLDHCIPCSIEPMELNFVTLGYHLLSETTAAVTPVCYIFGMSKPLPGCEK